MLNSLSYVMIPKYQVSDTFTEINDIAVQVLAETPELAYIKSYQYGSDGRFEVFYSKDKATVASHLLKTREKTYRIITALWNPDMTQYQLELTAHDYIVNNCVYDNMNFLNNTIPDESYSAYGALVLGRSVCSGYTKAMKILMDKMGVECICVEGKAANSDHTWNIVKIGKEYYHIDVTLDDPAVNDGISLLSHNYFNVTDTDISLSHEWDHSKYPACTATADNYFYVNELVVYNEYDIYSYIRNAITTGQHDLSIKASGFNIAVIDMDDVIQRAFNDSDTSFKSYVYYTIDEMGIINIQFF
jgi:hypothetical protein